mmetsp:Transcript_9715/g.24958  ORF Transcript_9715/g.24958 Transcript_9715/m.24958 type:complete len:242 (-) Transcript_9715:275-1000(-)
MQTLAMCIGYLERDNARWHTQRAGERTTENVGANLCEGGPVHTARRFRIWRAGVNDRHQFSYSAHRQAVALAGDEASDLGARRFKVLGCVAASPGGAAVARREPREGPGNGAGRPRWRRRGVAVDEAAEGLASLLKVASHPARPGAGGARPELLGSTPEGAHRPSGRLASVSRDEATNLLTPLLKVCDVARQPAAWLHLRYSPLDNAEGRPLRVLKMPTTNAFAPRREVCRDVARLEAAWQ